MADYVAISHLGLAGRLVRPGEPVSASELGSEAERLVGLEAVRLASAVLDLAEADDAPTTVRPPSDNSSTIVRPSSRGGRK